MAVTGWCSFDQSEPVHRLAGGVFAPCHLATGVTQAVRQRAPYAVASRAAADSATEAPLGPFEHADQHRALCARPRLVASGILAVAK